MKSMNDGRHLILTDVHGNIGALETALENVRFDEERDLLTSLGDVIDRGQHSRECMKFFARLAEAGRSPTMIAGNHEALLIEALLGDASSLDHWLSASFGATATLRSYGFDPSRISTAGDVLRVDGKPIRTRWDVEDFLLQVFGERHLSLLRMSKRSEWLEDFYPGVPAFLCHAGLTAGVPIKDTSPRQLVWGDGRWIRHRTSHPEPAVIIYGHHHGDKVIMRHKGICLAVEGEVAVLSCEDHVVTTSDGELIEIDRDRLGV
jgi:hypothetical protein